MKTLITRVFFLFLSIGTFIPLYAQVQTITGAQESQVRYLGRTGKISDKTQRAVPNIDAKKKLRKSHFAGPENFAGNVPMAHNNPNPLPIGVDPVRQLFGFLSVVIPVEPILNLEGISSEESGSTPPDTNGDVSPDHYVQTVNGGGSLFNVYDKDGVLIMGPISMNTLWEDFNGSGLGDPVILWDPSAERWLFSEISSSFSSMLIAVSETSDPLGNFYAYEFQAPDLPDYPKFGIWLDAYYFTTNEGSDTNVPVYILEREAMLNGDPTVEMQRVGVPKFPSVNEFAFQVCTPADWDGVQSPPPPGSPAYMVRMYDDAWDGGQDKLEVWEVAVDWDDENNTTVTGPIELFTEAFDANACIDGSIFDCLTDSDGNTVSALMHVLMHRVQYRNFGNYEVMVLNHVVDVDGNNLAGVRWYELRKPSGGEWTIYQQGTVSPDNNNRWMASIAMDGAGNIGLGYTIMGDDNTYDLAYTGRRSSDPLGEMTIDEYIFAEGQSNNPFVRWGDYSMMAVDEADARTFWYTGEYMKAGNNWGTRIVTFQLKRDTIDVGPLTILTPESSAYLTSSETVEVEVKNFGLEAQANFDVGLIIDDVFIESKNISSTLQPDSVVNIVFDTPIDMSVIGDYNFKIYTNLVDDQNILNDTLRKVISQLTRYDVAITSFLNIDDAICDTTREVGIVLSNIGAETITTANIDWSFNAGPIQTINWTGSLAMGASDTLYVTLEPLVNGTNNISATSSIPNGIADEDMSNDNRVRDFNAVTDGGFVQLLILTDNYPGETTWQLEDENGDVLYTGGPYTSAQTEYIEQWCLADACYTFKIFDSYGDGIQFGGIEGDYQITDENGIVLASLMIPNFGSVEENDFCSPFACSLDGDATTLLETAPGSSDGGINITATNGAAPFQYSIDGGSNFQIESFFGGLSGGTYTVVILDANDCTVEFEVIVETCTLIISADVTSTVEGETDGIIEVNTENGNEPFSYSINNGVTFQTSNIFDNLGAGDYTILVQDALGCVTTLEVTVLSTVGIDETTFGNSIEVFPNPTEGKFRINVKGIANASTINIRLIDASGRVIQRNRLVRYGEVLTGFLSVRNFPVGIYFIEFEHSEIQRMVKIVRK
jgi:type IX secretion system substrate protein/CARDB protein